MKRVANYFQRPAVLIRLVFCTLALGSLPLQADTPPRVIVGAGAGAGPHLKGFEFLRGEFTPFASFFAYDTGFQGGVSVATGDVNGDGIPDLIVGSSTLSSHVKVFDGLTQAVVTSFFAFPSFSGGVYVAAGDVNGDGRADIIVGTASTAAHVKVFDGSTFAQIGSFLPYGSGFSGGVNVAAGDVNGDGVADVVTGSASSSTHVKAFLGPDLTEGASFLAYGSATSGVFVAAGDVNGDGVDDLITGAGPSAGPHVKVFDGSNQALLGSFFAYSVSLTHGVRVASGDIDGDDAAEIVTSLGSGSDLVRVYSAGAVLVDEFNAYGGAEIGAFVAASPASVVRPLTGLRDQQSVRIQTFGGGYQELIYNYETSEPSVSPYANTPGAVHYNLPANQWIGIYHYDYTGQAFTQAVYQLKHPL